MVVLSEVFVFLVGTVQQWHVSEGQALVTVCFGERHSVLGEVLVGLVAEVQRKMDDNPRYPCLRFVPFLWRNLSRGETDGSRRASLARLWHLSCLASVFCLDRQRTV